MGLPAFNMVEYVDKLEGAGFTAEQAKAQTSLIGSIVDNHLVTKDDLRLSELKLENKIEHVETTLTHKIELVSRDLKLWAIGIIAFTVASSATVLYNIMHLAK